MYQKMKIKLQYLKIVTLQESIALVVYLKQLFINRQQQNMQATQGKPKRYEPHFPVTKIKKIIQENQEIGKLSNLVPPLIEKSLQYFLIDLIKKSEEVAKQNGVTKLTPAILKHALLGLDSYEFMKDALDDVDDNIISLAASKSKSSQKGLKRGKSDVQIKQSVVQQKNGRKRNKVSERQESQQSDNENQ